MPPSKKRHRDAARACFCAKDTARSGAGRPEFTRWNSRDLRSGRPQSAQIVRMQRFEFSYMFFLFFSFSYTLPLGLPDRSIMQKTEYR